MLYTDKNGISFKKLERSELNKVKDSKDESWMGTHKITIQNSDDIQNWFNNLKELYLSAYNSQGSFIGLYKILNIDWISRKYETGIEIFKIDLHNRYKSPLNRCQLGFKVLQAGLNFAFDILNLRKAECEILKTNIPSKLIALSLGMKIVGTRKESIFKNGKYIDSYVLEIFKGEVKNKKIDKNKI